MPAGALKANQRAGSDGKATGRPRMTDSARPVLVLGSGGRLGRLLRAVWPDDVPVIWQSRWAEQGMVECEFMTAPSGLRSLMSQVGAVICLAGVTDDFARRTGAPYSDNSDIALACLKAASDSGCHRVFLLSSAAVYGRATGVLRETDTCDPVSPYGEAKRAMERTALRFAATEPLEVCCLRLGNVAGADAALGNWKPGAEMDVFVSGKTPQRSYVGAQSLARILVALVRAKHVPQTLNVAAPVPIAMGDLLDAAGCAWKSRPAPISAIERVHLDTSLLQKFYEFAPREVTASNLVAQWQKAVGQLSAPRVAR